MPFSKTRWYQTWWGTTLLGFAVFILVILAFLGILTGKYWWQIRNNQGQEAYESIYGAAQVQNQDPVLLAKRKKLELADEPYLGNPNASVVIVEFIDFKCPFSKQSMPILDQVIKKYSSKVKLIVRDMPFASLHPGADKLAELADCAHQQGMFWPVYKILFDQQDTISDDPTRDEMHNLVAGTDINWEEMTKCLDSGLAKQRVNKDFADGMYAGVQGTPTFFVNGDMAQGVLSYKIWDNFLTNF